MNPDVVFPALIALFGVVLGLWANISVNSLRREMQVKLLMPRLEAYRELWSLMDMASPSLEKEFTHDEREQLEAELRSWYYGEGKGIFLSVEARNLLVEAKTDLLAVDQPNSKEIRTTLSKLRAQMKNDIGVYGKEDVNAPKKI